MFLCFLLEHIFEVIPKKSFLTLPFGPNAKNRVCGKDDSEKGFQNAHVSQRIFTPARPANTSEQNISDTSREGDALTWTRVRPLGSTGCGLPR
uniref:Uncharacterized protein n=1 Tax=Anguilla anguilla TaxID=7936 RepID=A0A0E9SPN3_ANGAN